MLCRQLDYQIHIVIPCGFVTAYRTAFAAFVDDDKSFFGVGLSGDGVHYALASCGTVTGIYVKVKGAEAFGAMVAGGISKGGNLVTAICANKAIVVFGESFCFHNTVL